MKRDWVIVCAALYGILLLLSGCFQEVERSSGGTSTPAGQTPEATSAIVAAPIATLPPTAVLTPDPTAVPAATQTPGPAPGPTNQPPITRTPMPPVPPSPTVPLPSPTSPLPSPTPVPPLVLQLSAPVDGSRVSSNAVAVHGVTNKGAAVTINGTPAIVEPDGRFRGEAGLAQGTNAIEVVAADRFGSRERQILTVTYIAAPPLPFMLIVTEPADQSIVSTSLIRLSGRTAPAAVVSVNGVSLALDILGLFATTVTLDAGPNLIDVVATNNDGQTMSTVIAVIFRP